MELTQRDHARLEHVHPDLVRIVLRAAELTPASLPWIVVQGGRTLEEQRLNVARGASKTMRSRHLIGGNGYCHAVDLCVVKSGKTLWNLGGEIAALMKQAAKELGIPLQWGGECFKGFIDTPHYQLPWAAYPADKPLTKSRTIAGAGTAATGGVVVGLAQLQQVTSDLQTADQHMQAGSVVGLAIAALIIAGSLYALYARWDDGGRPVPSFTPRWLRDLIGAA